MMRTGARAVLWLVTAGLALLGSSGAITLLPIAAPCNAVAQVRPLNLSANARRTPLVQLTPAPVRTLWAGTREPASAVVRSSDGHDWYKLCADDLFVQDSVVIAETSTATPRPSLTPTLAATRTPMPTFTPTRIVEIPAGIWIELSDGTLLLCEVDPCVVKIYRRLPDRRRW
jgi:hypothetical protein